MISYLNVQWQPWAYLAPFQRLRAISVEKCKFFPTPRLLYTRPNGFPLELDISARGRKLRLWDYGAEKEVGGVADNQISHGNTYGRGLVVGWPTA